MTHSGAITTLCPSVVSPIWHGDQAEMTVIMIQVDVETMHVSIVSPYMRPNPYHDQAGAEDGEIRYKDSVSESSELDKHGIYTIP